MSLVFNPFTGTFDFTGSGGSAPTTPGGAVNSVQYNNAGAFGGFGSWDGTKLTVPSGGTRAVELQVGPTWPYANTDYSYARVLASKDQGDSGSPNFEIVAAGGDWGEFQAFTSRGTLAAPTASQSGDACTYLSGYGHNGTTYTNLAQIAIEQDAAATASGTPGRMKFFVADGNDSLKEWMAIHYTGVFNFLDASLLTFGNSSVIRTDTTTAHTLAFQAYDVDGTTYKTFATLTNGNTPSFDLAAPSGGTLSGAFTTLSQGGFAISLAGTLTTSGAFASTFTMTGATSVTFPTSGTLATVAGTEVPLTFSTGLTRTVNTVTVNVSQNITTLSNLTTNGFVTTSGGVGTLGVQAFPVTVAQGGTNATSASITAFNNITGLSAAGTTGTTSTNLVFSTSPTITTPAITTSGTVTRDALGTSSTDGWILQNTTPAALAAQQVSPRLRLTGQGWSTSNGTMTVDWIAEVLPVQGSAAPSVNLLFKSQVNGGGYTTRATIESTGRITAGENLVATSDVQCGQGNQVLMGGTANSLRRDGADGFNAQRDGPNAQAFRLYNTFTTLNTNVEYFKFDWKTTANQFRMGAVKGSSTGTARVATWDYGDALASATAAITVPATSGNITFGGGITLPSGGDIVLSTTTGTKIGTGTTQLLGFYNATPIAQGASVADATGGAIIDAEARTAINALISRIEATGLIATV